jgi:hypothetical protein
MKKILIVGQGPSRNHKRGNAALDGNGSGDRLAKLAGMTRRELMERADTVNVLSRYYGSNGKGDSFPLSLAKKRAARLVSRLDSYDRVIFLGSNVGKAFGFSTIPSVQGRFYLVPHPSGINRWYNKLENRKLASKLLREALGV